MKYEHKFFPCSDPRHLEKMNSDLFCCACARREDKKLCGALSDTSFRNKYGRAYPCPFFKTVLQAAKEGNVPPID